MVLSAGYPLLVLQIAALLPLISWLLNVRYSRAGLEAPLMVKDETRGEGKREDAGAGGRSSMFE